MSEPLARVLPNFVTLVEMQYIKQKAPEGRYIASNSSRGYTFLDLSRALDIMLEDDTGEFLP